MRGIRKPLDGRPRRALGQYFTPRAVADFAARALAERGAFDGVSCRVIDPAAGPGLFLDAVLEAAPDADLIGLDIDRGLVGGRVRLGNGLLDDPEARIVERAFDAAVGNPPYGGLGLVELAQLARADETDAAWRLADAVACSEVLAASLGPPPPDLRARRLTPRLRRWLDRAFRHPIEGIFMERFVRLLRDGGWMAVVVPEGILANARAAALRAWMARQGRVVAVVGLPRVFAPAGATARTAILVYQRRLAPAPGALDGGAARVQISDVEMEWAARGQTRRRASLAEYLAAPPVVEVPWAGLAEQRWDPRFWDTRWAAPLDELGALPRRRLGEFITFMTYGPIVTRRRPADAPGDIPVVSQGQIEESGVNLCGAQRVAEGSVFDPPRCRVRAADLLLPRSGAGSLGRNRIAVYDDGSPAALGCFVDVIRLAGVNPWFVWIFLKTRFGWGQIRRVINGVGMPNISFDEIRSLEIPLVDAAFQDEVERRWRFEVRPAHETLLAACARGGSVDDLCVNAHRAEAEARMRTLVADVERALLARAGAFEGVSGRGISSPSA